MKNFAIVAAAAVLLSAAPAQAQEPRAIVFVSGGFQATANDFTQEATFVMNAEQGSARADYEVPGGPLFDGGVIVRVAGGFGVGVSVSYTQSKGDLTGNVRLPHPFFFNRHRELEISGADFARKETAAHIHVAYIVPTRGRLKVFFSGGPSFFSVKQEFLDDVNFNESYPYDTVTFSGVERREESENKTGFHVGGDVSYTFTNRFGLGAVVRYTRATIQANEGEDDEVEVDAGGLRIGGGIRIRF